MRSPGPLGVGGTGVPGGLLGVLPVFEAGRALTALESVGLDDRIILHKGKPPAKPSMEDTKQLMLMLEHACMHRYFPVVESTWDCIRFVRGARCNCSGIQTALGLGLRRRCAVAASFFRGQVSRPSLRSVWTGSTPPQY